MLLLVMVLFWPKNAYFLAKKMLILAKTKSTLVLNGIFSETKYERVIA